MNTVDIILIILIAAAVITAIAFMIRNKKKGKGCCNACSKCSACTDKRHFS
ncbi:MAG: FeoB-associated Cys-rich membrane protein [Lachnospiraceae bacterium]|nr:FeoB-associated Cys-rich membrane protein [Lachnospiraceae bacterium]